METAQSRERERDKARMADLRLPMDMEIATSGGEKTTLGKLVKGKNGVLLDFWASWCGPCMALMPELQKKAKRYGSRGIVVAGMNTENADKAEGVRRKRGIEFTWLVEPNGRPLSQMLKINSIPRMILVNPEGRVLFNGHPMNDELTTFLAELSRK
ncbi:MAG: TlpA disulfide reductase family protein [Opitutales bacterium]